MAKNCPTMTTRTIPAEVEVSHSKMWKTIRSLATGIRQWFQEQLKQKWDT